MTKKQLIKDLRFILSKYESNLVMELYPIRYSNTQSELHKFNKFIEKIISDKQSNLDNKNYSDYEYQKFLLTIIKNINASNQFQNSDVNDKKKAEQTIVSTSNEIKKAM